MVLDRRPALAGVLAIGLLLAGCGGSHGSTAAAPGTGSQSPTQSAPTSSGPTGSTPAGSSPTGEATGSPVPASPSISIPPYLCTRHRHRPERRGRLPGRAQRRPADAGDGLRAAGHRAARR